MKLLLLVVSVIALTNGRYISSRGLEKSDDWFGPLRDLGTQIIVETFDIEAVRGLVKETVEACMQEDDTSGCLAREVDTVADAVGEEVSSEEREDARVKVAALSDFLGAVHGACRDVAEEEIGKCAMEEGKNFCGRFDGDKKDCMKGVMYVLKKAKEMHDKATNGDKRGLDTSDDWFEPLRDLGTEVITETFGLEGVKEKVKASVEKCMQEDDTTECLKNEVDNVSDALGQDVPQAERDDAKAKVAALSDFLGAVHGACKDVPEDKIGECAFNEGKKFCSQAENPKKCMMGVMFVLKKAKEMAEGSDKRGLDTDDDWFEPLRDLGTEVITETFGLEGVKEKVKASVEKCMQEDDTTECLKNEVDTVSDALGQDVPQAERDDAKAKVAALSDFLGAVHGACKDVPEDKIGECAFNEGKKFCSQAENPKKCMMGVMFVLKKAKEMAEGSDKRGLDTDDDWFEPLRDLGTEVITETFGLEGVKEKVKASVEKCMQEDDTTECLKNEVDNVSDALGQDVPQAERDDAKAKVAALSDFLGAVHGACKDVPEDKIGECAFNEGKKFCSQAENPKKCMMGVMFVLKKAKEMAEGSDKRGLDTDDDWFEPLRDLGTEVITETFGLEGVKDKVKASVEKCMQEDDTTECLKNEVDTVSDALGQDVPQEERDDAKAKVAALSDFLGAVHGACKDVPEDKIGECAFNEGKEFCSKAKDQRKCMKGVMFVLKKAKEMADKQD